MDIDSAFRKSMCAHLGEQTYNRLTNKYIFWEQPTFLTIMSTEMHSEVTLVLIESFLADLSFEQAQKYVNAINGHMANSFIFYCVDVNLIERVIKYIPDVNIGNRCGSTALMYACDKLRLNMVKFLLDHGANVNIQNYNNETALIWLCKANNINDDVEQAIELLIFSGANPHIVSKYGGTSYDSVSNKSVLSQRCQQLLQGHIRMNNTKRAA